MSNEQYREEKKLSSQFSEYGYELFRMRTIGANSRAAHPHFHDAIECIYIIEGSVRIYVDGCDEVLYPGDFAIFRSRAVHSIYTEEHPKNSYYVFKLATSFLHGVTPTPVNGGFSFRFSVYNSELKIIWRREELENTKIRSILNTLVDGLASTAPIYHVSRIISGLDLLCTIYRDSEKDFGKLELSSDQIYKAIVYINKHFYDDIKEEDVARKFGMSCGYFSRSFKGATGKNFKDYLVKTRLNQAEQLIINTDMPIAEIATRCGYSTVSHFIHIYKKSTGKTPLQARKSNKEKA